MVQILFAWLERYDNRDTLQETRWTRSLGGPDGRVVRAWPWRIWLFFQWAWVIATILRIQNPDMIVYSQ